MLTNGGHDGLSGEELEAQVALPLPERVALSSVFQNVFNPLNEVQAINQLAPGSVQSTAASQFAPISQYTPGGVSGGDLSGGSVPSTGLPGGL